MAAVIAVVFVLCSATHPDYNTAVVLFCHIWLFLDGFVRALVIGKITTQIWSYGTAESLTRLLVLFRYTAMQVGGLFVTDRSFLDLGWCGLQEQD